MATPLGSGPIRPSGAIDHSTRLSVPLACSPTPEVAARWAGVGVPSNSAQSSSSMLGAEAVTMSQPVSEGETDQLNKTEPRNPLKNPTYPQRVHLHERAHWQ